MQLGVQMDIALMFYPSIEISPAGRSRSGVCTDVSWARRSRLTSRACSVVAGRALHCYARQRLGRFCFSAAQRVSYCHANRVVAQIGRRVQSIVQDVGEDVRVSGALAGGKVVC